VSQTIRQGKPSAEFDAGLRQRFGCGLRVEKRGNNVDLSVVVQPRLFLRVVNCGASARFRHKFTRIGKPLARDFRFNGTRRRKAY
jgi:hypothetical protein